ncbi:hypothetical protein F2981_18275 (plasmid) [Sinorhizobium meliloti]|nr:hypothetical protein [Sinorhizobium meliloti]
MTGDCRRHHDPLRRICDLGTQALSRQRAYASRTVWACLLGQHGQISLGKNAGTALWLAIEVETLSRNLCSGPDAWGSRPLLPDDEMERVIPDAAYELWPGADPEGVNDVGAPARVVKPGRGGGHSRG